MVVKPKNQVDDALIAHAVQTSHMEINVTLSNKKSCRLHGRSARVVDVCIPVVELLSPESTPQKGILASTAVTDFDQALKKLIKRGTKFYTVLRPNWAVPAILWTLE